MTSNQDSETDDELIESTIDALQAKVEERDKKIAHLKSEQIEIAKELNRQVSYWKKHADERRDRIAELERENTRLFNSSKVFNESNKKLKHAETIKEAKEISEGK